MNELIHGDLMSDVIEDLSVLSRKNLKFFKEHHIANFKKKLKMEKDLKKLGK